jgi:hypothetical protein
MRASVGVCRLLREVIDAEVFVSSSNRLERCVKCVPEASNGFEFLVSVTPWPFVESALICVSTCQTSQVDAMTCLPTGA